MENKLVYSAISKKNFYFKMHISKFILEKGAVPLNPFMLFEYFFLDTVNRNKIREANEILISRADELWVFGEISDGALKEIQLAKKLGKTIRHFSIINSQKIKEIKKEEAILEK